MSLGSLRPAKICQVFMTVVLRQQPHGGGAGWTEGLDSSWLIDWRMSSPLSGVSQCVMYSLEGPGENVGWMWWPLTCAVVGVLLVYESGSILNIHSSVLLGCNWQCSARQPALGRRANCLILRVPVTCTSVHGFLLWSAKETLNIKYVFWNFCLMWADSTLKHWSKHPLMSEAVALLLKDLTAANTVLNLPLRYGTLYASKSG